MKNEKICSIFVALSIVLSTVIVNTKIVNAAENLSITRTQAEERALKMINLTWTYSKDKNGNLNSGYSTRITQPDQLKNITNGQMQGIPYDWGGLDGLDTNSFNTAWTNFIDAINNGAYAGNVNTEAGYGYIPGTAGIDCSGFVQATFNIHDYKISTSTMFNKYFIKINLNDIKHMDILDRPGDHVVIFDKWGTLNGVSGAFTYEATPDATYGGIQGTKKYFLSMNEINNGYIPGRFAGIMEDSQVKVPHPAEAGTFAKVTNVSNNANIRMSPSTASSIITTIPKDTIIYLINYSSGWYQVSYAGKSGWIYGSLIVPIESGKYVTTTVAKLNIRSTPSTNSLIIGGLLQGQYAEVTDYSRYGQWMKVRINGVEGWSYRSYLSYIY